MSVTRYYYSRAQNVRPAGEPSLFRPWFVNRSVLPDYHFRQWSPPGKPTHTIVRARSRTGKPNGAARAELNAMEADPRFDENSGQRLKKSFTVGQVRATAPAKVEFLENTWGIVLDDAWSLKRAFREIARASKQASSDDRLDRGPPDYDDDKGDE